RAVTTHPRAPRRLGPRPEPVVAVTKASIPLVTELRSFGEGVADGDSSECRTVASRLWLLHLHHPPQRRPETGRCGWGPRRLHRANGLGHRTRTFPAGPARRNPDAGAVQRRP